MKSGKLIFNLVIGASIFFSMVCVAFGIYEWSWGHSQFFSEKAIDVTVSSNWGNYGSFLQGATASPWALAGFFIILVAFLVQNQQLAEQREQFRNQAEDGRRQDFENKFFQLINLHHKLVEDMVDGEVNGRVTGRDCFQLWYKSLKPNYWGRKNPTNVSSISSLPTLTPKRELEITVEAYEAVYISKRGDLGHYFRNLYHVIKFVDESEDIDSNLKKKYVTLVRAQLSAYEQGLLFYNCVSSVSEEFYKYVERYHLFHNLDETILLDQSHLDYFDDSAYETSGRVKVPNPRLERIRHPQADSKPA